MTIFKSFEHLNAEGDPAKGSNHSHYAGRGVAGENKPVMIAKNGQRHVRFKQSCITQMMSSELNLTFFFL
jgi:hypothetical protein